MSDPEQTGSEQREEAVVEVKVRETRHGMIAVLGDVDAGPGARAPTDAERKATELHNKILDRIDESAYEPGDVIAHILVPDEEEPWIDWNEDVVGAAGDDPHIECDGSGTGSEHKLERQTWSSEIEIFDINDDGELAVCDTESRGPVKNEDTIECTCGREFSTDRLGRERAAEHLRTARGESR